MLVFVSKGLINTVGPLHVLYDFLVRSDNKIYACVRSLFLCVDNFSEAFKACFLFFVMTTIISPYEFMLFAFIGSVVSDADIGRVSNPFLWWRH